MREHYRRIPGWCDFEDFYARMVAWAPDGSHFVEVGAYLGRSACYMASCIKRSGKQIRFDAVDIWLPYDPEKTPWMFSWLGDKEASLARQIVDAHGGLKEAFLAFMDEAGVAEYVNAVHANSVTAASLYADRSLDFVYIDANHKYEAVLADLAAWVTKIRPGGVLGGHDYSPEWPGVEKAVHEVFGNAVGRVSVSSWMTRIS